MCNKTSPWWLSGLRATTSPEWPEFEPHSCNGKIVWCCWFWPIKQDKTPKKSSWSVEVPVAQWSEYVLHDWRDAGSNPAWTWKHGWSGHPVEWSWEKAGHEGGGIYPGVPPGDFQGDDQEWLYILSTYKKIPGFGLSRQFSCSGFWITHHIHVIHTEPSIPEALAGIWTSNLWPMSQSSYHWATELFTECAGTYISPINLHQNRTFTLYK